MSTVTNVSSVALHLIEVDHDTVKTAVISSIISNGDFNGEMFKSTITGLSSKMARAYDYAKTEYTLALPSGVTTSLKLPSKLKIANAIKADVPYPLGVLVSFYRYDTYEPYFEVLNFLTTNRLFNLRTGVAYAYPSLSFTNNQELRLISSTLSVDGLSVIINYEYWGYVSTLVDGSPVDAWQKISDQTEAIARPDITNTVFGDRLLVAWYIKLNAFGAPDTYDNIWIYRIATDTYPLLNPYISEQTSDEYLPVIPLRYNNVDLTGQNAITAQADLDAIIPQVIAAQAAYNAAFAIDGGVGSPPPSEALYTAWQALLTTQTNLEAAIAAANAIKETPLYLTSKKLLDTLSMPIDGLGDKINESPDIAEIDHAYVVFGADLQSNEKATLAYLNEYFDYIGTLQAIGYDATAVTATTGNGTPVYADTTLTEYGLSLALAYSTITTEYVTGTVGNGKIGNATKLIEYTRHDAVSGAEGEPTIPAYTDTSLTLDLQVTASVIRRVIVRDLETTNYVDGNYTVVATLDAIKDDPENHNLIVPLEYNMTLGIPTRQRTDLYADCTLLVINAIVKTKLKWYQETWFSVVLMIVAIVITVWTGQGWVIALVEAGFSVGVAILIVMAMMVALTMAVNLITKWMVRHWGWAGAIVATIAAIVLTRNATGLIGIEATAMTTAQMVLQVSNALISSVNEMIKYLTEQVVDEYNTFAKLMGDAYDDLNTKAELAGLKLDADYYPLNFSIRNQKTYYSIAGESPGELIDRCLGLARNTYETIHNQIPDFCSTKLRVDTGIVRYSLLS